MTEPSLLNQPLSLPCGATLPNRLCKASMTEGLADKHLRATPKHATLYRSWSEGGTGLLLSGNVQVDRRVLERPGNVCIDMTDSVTFDDEAREQIKAWTSAATVGGNHFWVQLGHAGRQSPNYVTREPLAPSEVQLDLLGNFAKPRALSESEILETIERFAHAAKISRECGFTGVQIHGAHGYLISSFLSPVTNQRTDAWGGSLDNRARLLLETVRAVRKAVGNDFPICVKLNSDDFRKGGFTNDDCLRVVQWLNTETLDLLEVSGGNYEQPVLLGHEGDSATAAPVKESTRKREAYFMDYAARIREVATMPMMVTGGFRSAEGMEQALQDNALDMIGVARPLVVDPACTGKLLRGELAELPAFDEKIQLAQRGFFSAKSPIQALRALNVFTNLWWYYANLLEMGKGKACNLELKGFTAMRRLMVNEYLTAFRMHRARKARA